MRRKLQVKVQEMQETSEAAKNRINSLEKAHLRLTHELEDTQMDADKVTDSYLHFAYLTVVVINFIMAL